MSRECARHSKKRARLLESAFGTNSPSNRIFKAKNGFEGSEEFARSGQEFFLLTHESSKEEELCVTLVIIAVITTALSWR